MKKRTFRLTESRPDPGRDVRDEIGFHLEMRTQEYRERGLSTDEARRAALASFGDVELVAAECRDERARRTRARSRAEGLDELRLDLRYALRTLRRSTAFTVAAVATLALGIGATGAVLTVVDGVLLRPLPYADPGRLVMVWQTGQGLRGPELQWPLSAPNYLDLQAWNRSLGSVAAFRSWPYVLGDGAADPEQLAGARVAPVLFTTLGVRPLLGRTFSPDEAHAGAEPVAVIGHDLWQRRFGGDPTIVGRRATLSGERYTIVGIMPPGFAFPRGAELPSGLQFRPRTEVWTPLVFSEQDLELRGTLNLAAVARLRDRVEGEQLSADLRRVAERLRTEHGRFFSPQMGLQAVPLGEQAAAPVRPALLVLAGAVGLVLLIACMNVANLLLARTAARERELAVRAALGATRGRLTRQLLTETLLLTGVGALLGLGAAAVSTRALLALVPGSLPRADDVSLDLRVALATFLVGMLAGATFGAASAARTTRPRPTALHGVRSAGSTTRRAGRRLLVAAEVALSIVLLVGAGLLIESFVRLQRVAPGFDADGVVTAGVLLPLTEFDQRRDGPEWARTLGAYAERLASIPGVRAAGGISALPLSGASESASFAIVGDPPGPPGQRPSADYAIVTPGLFDALRVPLVAGRRFDARDRLGTPLSVVVNQAAMRRYWKGRDPIGTRIDFFGDEPATVVGVVGDVRQHSLDVPPQPAIYLPQAQYPYPFLSFVVRADGEPAAVLPAMRRELAALAPGLALHDARSLRNVLDESLARQRFSMVVIGVFAAAALLLALVGLYGVVSYVVAQRTRELGVRAALGASQGDVLRLVLGEGLRVTALGMVAGLLGAIAATRLLRSQLFEVSPTSPLVYVVVAALTVAVTLVASWVPARRAARIAPTLALRGE